jgi:hypothetical protein
VRCWRGSPRPALVAYSVKSALLQVVQLPMLRRRTPVARSDTRYLCGILDSLPVVEQNVREPSTPYLVFVGSLECTLLFTPMVGPLGETGATRSPDAGSGPPLAWADHSHWQSERSLCGEQGNTVVVMDKVNTQPRLCLSVMRQGGGDAVAFSQAGTPCQAQPFLPP